MNKRDQQIQELAMVINMADNGLCAAASIAASLGEHKLAADITMMVEGVHTLYTRIPKMEDEQ